MKIQFGPCYEVASVSPETDTSLILYLPELHLALFEMFLFLTHKKRIFLFLTSVNKYQTSLYDQNRSLQYTILPSAPELCQ